MSVDDLPSPPFVTVPGVANFRDIGGYPTSSGHQVTTGLVYRSADPTRVTKEGLEKLSRDLGITTIFDFRSAPEIRRQGPEWADIEASNTDIFEPHGIKREWVPVFAEADYGPEQIALRYREYTRAGSEGFVKAYNDILVSGTDAYTAVFRHLALDKPTPCLVHCTAGKDRTGVIVALIFLLVGVDEDKIAEEYSLTDQGLKHLKPLFTERLLKNPALEGNVEGVGNMVSSKKENMTASIAMIKEQFGSAEAYLRSKCGFSDADIEQVKRNLTQRTS